MGGAPSTGLGPMGSSSVGSRDREPMEDVFLGQILAVQQWCRVNGQKLCMCVIKKLIVWRAELLPWQPGNGAPDL